MYLLEKKITKFSTAYGVTIDNSKDLFSVPVLDMLTYLSLLCYKNGTIGANLAEGSFYIKNSGEHFFSPVSLWETRQRSHTTLFEAFKLVFKTNRKIEDDGYHMKFSVSSTKDLINVVPFRLGNRE